MFMLTWEQTAAVVCIGLLALLGVVFFLTTESGQKAGRWFSESLENPIFALGVLVLFLGIAGGGWLAYHQYQETVKMRPLFDTTFLSLAEFNLTKKHALEWETFRGTFKFLLLYMMGGLFLLKLPDITKGLGEWTESQIAKR